jgi:ABC-type uncharacterized transport system permease subunit
MNRLISQTLVKFAESSLRRKITAAMMFVIGGILVYISRKEPELPLTRIYIPNLQTQVTYVWQLLLVAGLLFLTALAILFSPFLKKKD